MVKPRSSSSPMVTISATVAPLTRPPNEDAARAPHVEHERVTREAHRPDHAAHPDDAVEVAEEVPARRVDVTLGRLGRRPEPEEGRADPDHLEGGLPFRRPDGRDHHATIRRHLAEDRHGDLAADD